MKQTLSKLEKLHTLKGQSVLIAVSLSHPLEKTLTIPKTQPKQIHAL